MSLNDVGVQRCEDLGVVLRLACLTADRTDAEQRALLRVARSVDTEVNRLTDRNTRMWCSSYITNTVTRIAPESRLEQLVGETRELGEKDRAVSLPAKKGKPPAEQLPEGWTLVEYGGSLFEQHPAAHSEDVVHTGGLV